MCTHKTNEPPDSVYRCSQWERIVFKLVDQTQAATGHTKHSGVVPFISIACRCNVNELFDSTRGNGVHTFIMNNGTNYATAAGYKPHQYTWPNAPAGYRRADAHWAGEMVYDYWKNVQGRLSWDNLDGILLQYVHYSSNCYQCILAVQK